MSTKTTDIKDKPELIKAARIASDSTEGFWDRLAEHFDQQRGLVEPRIDKNQPKGDY